MQEEKKYVGRGGWRGGGRPQKPGEEKRVRFQVSCTPDEQEQIKKLAKEKDKTVSRLLIDAVLDNS